jgi:hypothetical protein
MSFICVLASGLCLLGQEYRGSIQGRVTDPSGAAVPGASIAVKNTDTGVPVEATTNAEGNFQVPFLLPGNYSVQVTHAGFKKAERNEVRVNTNSRVDLEFALQLGAASETVTVDSETPLLQTRESDLGVVMNNNIVSNVAVSIYRNAINFARLAPGVSGAPAGTYTSDNQTQLSISGGGGANGAS